MNAGCMQRKGAYLDVVHRAAIVTTSMKVEATSNVILHDEILEDFWDSSCRLATGTNRSPEYTWSISQTLYSLALLPKTALVTSTGRHASLANASWSKKNFGVLLAACLAQLLGSFGTFLLFRPRSRACDLLSAKPLFQFSHLALCRRKHPRPRPIWQGFPIEKKNFCHPNLIFWGSRLCLGGANIPLCAYLPV
jgi:hypothetical protein